MTIVEARSLTRVFPMQAGPVTAVREASLRIESGDYVAIGGPSGCGKSTLLHLLGCVDTPTTGSVWFEGRDVGSLSDRTRIRLRRIGFVFRRYFCCDADRMGKHRNCRDPGGRAGGDAPGQIASFVELATARIISVAIRQRGCGSRRRAGAGESPALLLADEPTSERRGHRRHRGLFDRVHAEGTAILLVTHNASLAARARTRLGMRSGILS